MLAVRPVNPIRWSQVVTTRIPTAPETRGKFLRIRFVGTTVTTPPRLGSIFLEYDASTSESAWFDSAALIQPVVNPDFSAWAPYGFRVKGDIDLLGFEFWPAVVSKTMHVLNGGVQVRTPVYWNGAAFVQIPADHFNDPSVAGRAPLNIAAEDHFNFRKATGTSGWNSGTNTVESFTGDIELTCSFSGGRSMIGFNNAPGGNSFEDLDYAMFRGGTFYTIYESNVRVFTSAVNVGTNPVKMTKVGPLVRYYVDDALIYTSLNPAAAPSYVLDLTLYEGGARINDVALFASGIYQTITWENAVNMSMAVVPTNKNVPTTHAVRISKPADASKCYVTTYLMGGSTFTRVSTLDMPLPIGAVVTRKVYVYLLGYRQSEDEASAIINERVTIEAQCLDPNTMTGANVVAADSLTRVSIRPGVVDDTPGITTLTVINARTLDNVLVSGLINNNNRTLTADVSLERSAGDGLVGILSLSKDSNEPSGGFIFLSG
jgi:hypothetical protein